MNILDDTIVKSNCVLDEVELYTLTCDDLTISDMDAAAYVKNVSGWNKSIGSMYTGTYINSNGLLCAGGLKAVTTLPSKSFPTSLIGTYTDSGVIVTSIVFSDGSNSCELAHGAQGSQVYSNFKDATLTFLTMDGNNRHRSYTAPWISQSNCPTSTMTYTYGANPSGYGGLLLYFNSSNPSTGIKILNFNDDDNWPNGTIVEIVNMSGGDLPVGRSSVRTYEKDWKTSYSFVSGQIIGYCNVPNGKSCTLVRLDGFWFINNGHY